MTVDSSLVLLGQTLAYTLYALAMITLVGWFALRVTREGDGRGVQPRHLLLVRRLSRRVRRVAAHHHLQHDPVGAARPEPRGHHAGPHVRDLGGAAQVHAARAEADGRLRREGPVHRDVEGPDVRLRAVPPGPLDGLPDAGAAGPRERHPLGVRPRRRLHDPVDGVLRAGGHRDDRARRRRSDVRRPGRPTERTFNQRGTHHEHASRRWSPENGVCSSRRPSPRCRR